MRALRHPCSSPAALLRRQAAGGDRRACERLLAYWDSKLDEFGDRVTIAALDLGIITRPYRSSLFLIAVDPIVERSSLVLYGEKFADSLQLPEKPRTDLSLARQLPHRYAQMFLHGCAQAQEEREPVRLEGEIDSPGGNIERYRVAFIPVGVRPNALTCFAFGAFGSRLVDPPALARRGAR
jgi:hypothetical protein